MSEYSTRFSRWDECASVRTKKRRILSDDKTEETLYFTPELVAYSSHPIVQKHGLFKESLLRHLYQYLHFTTVLEHQFVNKVTQNIAHSEYHFKLPNKMLIDAHRIYCDEAYHALASVDVIHQIRNKSGVDYAPINPRLFMRLNKMERAAPINLRYLVGLLFVIVSETLISSVLVNVHRDKRINGGVRLIIKDHAEDESVHHSYFSQLLYSLWPRLTIKEKHFAAPLFAEFIEGFLMPDLQQVTHLLGQMKLRDGDIRKVLHDCYSEMSFTSDLKKAAGSTLKLLKAVGVFDSQHALDACEVRGISPV